MYKHFFKRLLDFCISLMALIIISPVLVVVTIWLHFANKWTEYAAITVERDLNIEQL